MRYVCGNNNNDKREYFVYNGQEGDDVPEDVIRVRVHPSVRAIKDWAFWGRRGLAIVILNNGLEEIGYQDFFGCTSLGRIAIPDAVRAIKDGALHDCFGMKSATLGDRLEEIGEDIFS